MPSDFFKPQTSSVDLSDMSGDMGQLEKDFREYGLDKAVLSSGRRSIEDTKDLLRQRKKREGLAVPLPEEVVRSIDKVLLRGDSPDNIEFPSNSNWRTSLRRSLKDKVDQYGNPIDTDSIIRSSENIRNDYGGLQSDHLSANKVDISGKNFGGIEGLKKIKKFLNKKGYKTLLEENAGEKGVLDIKLKDIPKNKSAASNTQGIEEMAEVEDKDMMEEITNLKDLPFTDSSDPNESELQSLEDVQQGNIFDSFNAKNSGQFPEISSANQQITEGPLQKLLQSRRDITPESRLQDAQKSQKRDLAGLAFLKAAQRDSKGSQNIMEQLAKAPTSNLKDAFALEDKSKKEAGDSSAAGLFRDIISKQQPDLEVPKDVPVNYLQKLLQLKQKISRSAPFQQSQYMTQAGDPIHFNKQTGKYINTITGEEVKDKGSVIRNYVKTITDPITGETIEVRPGVGAVNRISADSIPSDTKTSKKDIKPTYSNPRDIYDQLNPAERDQINKFTDKFASDTKDERQSLAKVDRVAKKTFEAMTNPIAAAQLGAEVATIFENGRLTDEDVLRYTRRLGITDRLEDALQSAMDGTINAEKAKLIRMALENYSRDSKKELSKRALGKARLAAVRINKNIAPEDLAGLIYENYERRIRVVNKKTGKEGTIPADQVERALKSGNFEVVQ